MYQQTDKISAIKEIQKYLFVISDSKYNEVPRVPIDGIFDNETELAVIKFQESVNLSPTGIVDFITFKKLFEEYKSITENLNTTNYIFGDSSFPLKENDQNEDVRALHVMISKIRKTFPYLTDPGHGSYYSQRTADSIEEMRKLFMLPRSRNLDKELYRRMIVEINGRQHFKEKFQ